MLFKVVKSKLSVASLLLSLKRSAIATLKSRKGLCSLMKTRF
jgi:hypothetical protein